MFIFCGVILFQEPQSLYRSNGYDHREALFGSLPYGEVIAEYVSYASDDLCDPQSIVPSRYADTYILMVDRGGCSFVSKARSAQLLGASALIIADSKCLCDDDACLSMQVDKGGDTSCQKTMPLMSDDGTASDILIPTVLMSTMDSLLIKEVLVRNEPVYMQLSWPVNPVPIGAKVDYELWTTPFDFAAYDFQETWKDIVESLDERTSFTPHLFIYDGISGGCRNETDPGNPRNLCHSMCSNVGRYCVVDPDGDLDRGISGRDVIEESLRRLCIWEHYGKDGVGIEYWEYLTEFLENCENIVDFTNEDCIDTSLAYSNIDKTQIEQCMADTGGLESPSVNVLLEKQIDSAISRAIMLLPTKFVNEMPIRGSLTSANVFNALCASFGADSNKPEVCIDCQNCPDIKACTKQGACNPTVTIADKDESQYGDSIPEEVLFWTKKLCDSEIGAIEQCMVGIDVSALTADSCLTAAKECQMEGSLLFQPFEILSRALPVPDECEVFYEDDYSVTILLNKFEKYNSKCSSFPKMPTTSQFSKGEEVVIEEKSSNAAMDFFMFVLGCVVTGIALVLYNKVQTKKEEDYLEVDRKEFDIGQEIVRQGSEVI